MSETDKPRRVGEYAALTDALIRDAGDLLGPCVHCGDPVKVTFLIRGDAPFTHVEEAEPTEPTKEA